MSNEVSFECACGFKHQKGEYKSFFCRPLSEDQQAALNGMTEGGPSWGSEPVDYFLGGKANVK